MFPSSNGCAEKPHNGVGMHVIPFEIVRPKNCSRRVREAKQISLRAERIDLAAADDRRGARTGGITDAVGAIVFVLPKNFPVGFVQTKHALASRESYRVETGWPDCWRLRQAVGP